MDKGIDVNAAVAANLEQQFGQIQNPDGTFAQELTPEGHFGQENNGEFNNVRQDNEGLPKPALDPAEIRVGDKDNIVDWILSGEAAHFLGQCMTEVKKFAVHMVERNEERTGVIPWIAIKLGNRWAHKAEQAETRLKEKENIRKANYNPDKNRSEKTKADVNSTIKSVEKERKNKEKEIKKAEKANMKKDLKAAVKDARENDESVKNAKTKFGRWIKGRVAGLKARIEFNKGFQGGLRATYGQDNASTGNKVVARETIRNNANGGRG